MTWQNPHLQYNQPMGNNQQMAYPQGYNPYQTNLTPQQLQMLQQQQMLQQRQMMPGQFQPGQQAYNMNPHYQQMLQQQLLQQQLLQQQMMQQQMLQQQMMQQQTFNSRFGASVPNMSVTSREQFNPSTASLTGRYGMQPQTNPMQEVEQALNTPQPEVINPPTDKFVVLPEKDISFVGNDLIKLMTYISEIKDNQLDKKEEVTVVDCLEEARETVYELGGKTSKLIITADFIVTTNFIKTSPNVILPILNNTKIKEVYKTLKKMIAEVKDKRDMIVINKFDDILTDYINEFLVINTKGKVSIDSFSSDFNSLLKALRNYYDELEDDLLTSLDLFFKNFKESIDIVSEKLKLDEASVSSFIAESIAMAYIDKMLIELGLNTISDRYVEVDKNNPANITLLTLYQQVARAVIRKDFYLVTMDKSVVKFNSTTDDKIFVKRVM